MSARSCILIVDDDRSLQLESYLDLSAYEVRRAFDCESALNSVLEWKNRGVPAPCLAFIDIVLPVRRGDAHADPRAGLKLMPELQRILPDIHLVPITGKGWGAESAEERSILDEARLIGIRDYISKPVTRNELLAVIERAFGLRRGKTMVAQDIKRYPVHFDHGEVRFIVSVDKTMQDQVIGRVAMEGASDRPVLILGETGTGKELIARAVHGTSNRERFHSVNCAAIPESLIESELFGYERGAFSGAERQKKGKFELAHQGTLFLDEVGDLSLSAQAKLLRVLQEQEFERVGGSETLRVDVRIVAATNQDLAKRIDAGEFRADLFYRLEGLVIEIPPLRDRLEDIELIAQYYLETLNEKHQTSREFGEGTLKALLQYRWPGNVRELQNVVHHLFFAAGHNELLLERDLPGRLKGHHCRLGACLRDIAREVLHDDALSLDVLSMLLTEEVYRQADKDSKKTRQALEISANTLYKYKRSLDEVSQALIQSDFDEKKAARLLPDFGSSLFLRKRLRALLYGKTESEIRHVSRRQGYPPEWLRYMQDLAHHHTRN